jgi:hypothetical protein
MASQSSMGSQLICWRVDQGLPGVAVGGGGARLQPDRDGRVQARGGVPEGEGRQHARAGEQRDVALGRAQVDQFPGEVHHGRTFELGGPGPDGDAVPEHLPVRPLPGRPGEDDDVVTPSREVVTQAAAERDPPATTTFIA